MTEKLFHTKTIALFTIALALLLVASCKDTAIVTATSGLYMRDQPARTGNQLDLIPASAEVEVLEVGPVETIDGIQAPWKRIKQNEKEGWVFGAYLMDASDQEAVNKFKSCNTIMGYWHNQEQVCYPPQLRKLTQKGTIPGYCGAENYTLFPDGRVWVSGMYVEQPRFLGSWSYEYGDSIVLDNGSGVKLRARPDGPIMKYEQLDEHGNWSQYALAGSSSCPW
ncbi:MAG: hypothetical protein CMN76_02795 [Spirochaetaceae bacterium]|nr:hypothetical protein [Spirochaetaceae bacterium]|tara:strand:+ start:1874 stop:2542 length:669 start_codon:yes stop_codon:yes gene_type:complete